MASASAERCRYETRSKSAGSPQGAVAQAFVPGLFPASVSAFPLAGNSPGTNALTDRAPLVASG
jgi:hypothetical protein